MEFTLSSYSLSLLIFAVFVLVMAVMLFTRLSKEVKWFGAMMVAVSIWAASDGIMVGINELDKMLFIVNFEYVGIAFVPVFWLLFILKFVGKDEWLTPKWVAWQFLFPLLTLIMVWTNGYHHLHYQDVSLKEINGLYGLLTSKGPWYIIHTTYFYLAISIGFYLLLRHFQQAEGMYKKQALIILTGTLVPWIANILVVFQVEPFNGIDPTPHAFMVTCVIVVFGFFELRLFDVKPIARYQVVESMKSGMMVVDGEQRVVDTNPYLCSIMGMTSGEITGKSFYELGFGKEEWETFLRTDQEVKRQQVFVVDGQKAYFEISCKFVKMESKKYDGRLLLFRDVTQFVTDQRRLELQAQELQELNSTKDRLLSIISHDLKNPVNSLTQFLEMLGSGDISQNELTANLPLFAQNLKHVSTFMENLLEWAQSQLKGENINAEEFNIHEEIGEVIGLFDSAMESKGITAHIYGEDRTMVYGDLNMVRLVIRNLISNAVKFCDEGDRINLHITSCSDQVQVKVADTGMGIAEENLSKLFSNTAFTTYGTQKEKGTGLGLMLTKDFVEKNGGEIWVESEEGNGSSFFFTLPAAPFPTQ